MRILKTVLVVLAFSVLPLRAAAQQVDALGQVVDRIVSQEQAEMNSPGSIPRWWKRTFRISGATRTWGLSRQGTSTSWVARSWPRESILSP